MANEVELIIGAATDVGRERQVNEDSHGYVRSAAGDLLIVCDGMGGHAAGDLASRTARDAIAAYCATYAASIAPRELLERAILHAHESVRSVAAQSQANAGMGTTCVLTLVRGNQAWVANVGDSRCYLVRGGHPQQLSVDHTKARKLLDAGIITAEQFANHPEKGVLAQALGQRAVPQPFVSDAIALVVDDYVVLCSDGVYDSTERDLSDLTAANNPNYAAHNLAIEAVKRDGKDNATVVIGRYVNMNRATAAVVAPAVPVGPAVVTKPAIPWKHPQFLGVLAGVLALGAGIGWGMAGFGRAPVAAAVPPAESQANVEGLGPKVSGDDRVQPDAGAEEGFAADAEAGDGQSAKEPQPRSAVPSVRPSVGGNSKPLANSQAGGGGAAKADTKKDKDVPTAPNEKSKADPKPEAVKAPPPASAKPSAQVESSKPPQAPKDAERVERPAAAGSDKKEGTP